MSVKGPRYPNHEKNDFHQNHFIGRSSPEILHTQGIEPWSLVSLGFRSVSFTIGQSLRQSLTFHSNKRMVLDNTLCSISHRLISPLDSGKEFCRVIMRQTVPTSGEGCVRADFATETVICAFSLPDSYTRWALSIIFPDVASQRLRLAPNS